MVYLVSVLLLFFAFLIGNTIVELMNLKKYKHASCYGALVYISGFFIISGVFTFLHLSWNLYFIVMTLYNVLLLLFVIYMFITKKVTLQISVQGIVKYFKDNYLVLITISIFIFLYLCSSAAFLFGDKYPFGMAIIDDFIYLSRASHIIDTPQIMQEGINSFTGAHYKWSGTDYLVLVSFWEMFWAYGSQFFHLGLTEFSRVSLAIVIYVLAYFSIDEVLYLYTPRKVYQKVKYVILACLLMYGINGMQWEVYKFMFLPWFGNNFSLIFYIPILFILIYHAVYDKKFIALLFLFPFISVGFTTVTMVYTIMLFPFSMYILFKYKNYQIEKEKLLYIGSGVIFLIFAIVAIYGNTEFKLAIQELFVYTKRTSIGEKEFFVASFINKLFLITPGILLFFYRKTKKELFCYEKELIFYFGIIVLLSLSPLIANVFFNLLSFSYRRFLESVLLFFVLYSAFNVLLALKKVGFKQLSITFLILAIIFNKTPGFFILKERSFFSIKNLHSTTRELEVAEQLTSYFSQIPETKYICIYPDRALPFTNDEQLNSDLGGAITQIPQHYLVLSCNAKVENLDYIVIPADMSINELSQKQNVSESDLVHTIETDEISVNIYKVH